MATELSVGRIDSVASKKNTQREYETVLILRPETGKPEISDLIRRMQKVITERGGNLLKIDSWGIRVLAYPIRHCRKGIYLYWRYLGGSDMVAEFERHMRLLDRVLRFYTVRVDEDVDPSARPSEVTDALVDTVSDPGPDPEELARKAAEEAARKAAEDAAAAAAAEQARREAEASEREDEDDDEASEQGEEDDQ
jgi:small subunit ribosomal protein S6